MEGSQQLSPKAAAVLAQFPGPVRIRASWTKWLFLAVASCIFSMFMFVASLTFVARGAWGYFFVGLVFGLWFAFVAIKTFSGVFRRSMGLILDSNGFYARSQWGRGQRYLWQTTTHFVPTRLGPRDTIAFEDALWKNSSFWTRNNRSRLGGNAWLGDDYGFDTKELAWLMEEWRQKALQTALHTPDEATIARLEQEHAATHAPSRVTTAVVCLFIILFGVAFITEGSGKFRELGAFVGAVIFTIVFALIAISLKLRSRAFLARQSTRATDSST
jgi:hypothetical protein